MSVRTGHFAIAAVFCLLSAVGVQAQSFSVTPNRLEVAPPANRAQITLRSGGTRPAILQIRILGWQDGTDPATALPTREVVANPPMAHLRPRQELTVRLVRVARPYFRERRCFHILVDRLPTSPAEARSMTTADRRTVPLCFD